MVTSKRVKRIEQCRDEGEPDFVTPTRVRVLDLTAFAQQNHLDVSQNAIFQWCGVSKQRGYEMIQDSLRVRRKHHREEEEETRGRKPIFGPQEWAKLEEFLLRGGFGERVCGYEEIVQWVWPEVYQKHPNLHLQTIRAAFNARGYHKCVACQKPWFSDHSIRQRREFLQQRRHWTTEQWRQVRFSDECHFEQGPKRKLKVVRPRGERYHKDCIQKPKKLEHENEKHYHFWAAVGYNFKSSLIRYETSPNGKLTPQVYLDAVLKTEVQKWINEDQEFILEEHQDSSRGTARGSVKTWKESQGLEYFFNAGGSPDLSPIENIWRTQKQKINEFDHDDDEAVLAAIYAAWDAIPQAIINRYVDTMIKRMRDLDDADKTSERGSISDSGCGD